MFTTLVFNAFDFVRTILTWNDYRCAFVHAQEHGVISRMMQKSQYDGRIASHLATHGEVHPLERNISRNLVPLAVTENIARITSCYVL